MRGSGRGNILKSCFIASQVIYAFCDRRLSHLCHEAKHQLGVTIVAPPPPVTAKQSCLGRASISFDFEAERATCAAGITVDAPLRVFTAQHQRTTLLYRWPASACQNCALRQPCNGNQARGHRVLMHPYEPELRQARIDWQTPHIRELYRSRSQTERLIYQVVRHGGRQARAWGLDAAHLQVHCIVMQCNLALLAKALAQREQHTTSGLAA